MRKNLNSLSLLRMKIEMFTVILILALLFSPPRFISLLIPWSIMRDPRAGHTSGYCPHVASSLTGADGPMAPTTAMAFPRTHVSSHHCSIDLPHNGIMTQGMPTLDQTPAPGSHTASLCPVFSVTSHSSTLFQFPEMSEYF